MERRTMDGLEPPRRYLELGASALAALKSDAETAWPNEACGVLFGARAEHGARVIRVVPCHNAAGARATTRYEIDPREVLRAEREAREHGLELVGFYHSHPDGPAHPSPDDLEDARWEGCAYVIVRVDAGRAGEARAFTLRSAEGEGPRRFVPERIVEGR